MKREIEKVPGIGPHSAEALAQAGFTTVAKLASATVEQVSAVPGFGSARAGEIIRSAAQLLAEKPAPAATARKKKVTPKAPAAVVEESAESETPETKETKEEKKKDKKKDKKKKDKKKDKKKKDKKKDKKKGPARVWAEYKRKAKKQ